MNTKRTLCITRLNGKRQRVRITAGSLGLLAGLAFTLTAQAEPRAGAFQMLVAEDSPSGQYLIEGDVEAALALDETRSINRFNALNDRCVSLTLTGKLDRAEVVCNNAVREARRSDAGAAPGRSVQDAVIEPRSRRAMAFTNRGVLYALQGRGELAREDFDTAVILNGRLTAAAENLAVLDARPAMASVD